MHKGGPQLQMSCTLISFVFSKKAGFLEWRHLPRSAIQPFVQNSYLSCCIRKPTICIYAKTKTQISCTVTAQPISIFVVTTQIVQSLFFLKPKVQAPSLLLCLYRPVCVRPVWKPKLLDHGKADFIDMKFLVILRFWDTKHRDYYLPY